MSRTFQIDEILHALAARQHGALTRRQAERAGIDAHALGRRRDAGLLDERHAGVLVIGSWPRTFDQDVMAATLAGGKGTYASGPTSGVLHALDGFSPGPVELVAARPKRVRLPGAVVHPRP